MKVLPIILRLVSGSSTPDSLPRISPQHRRVSASCPILGKGRHHLIAFIEAQQPLSTNTQVSWSPIARCRSAATTEIHSSGKPQQHLVLADSLLHRRNGILNDAGSGPQPLAAANVEVNLSICAFPQRMRDFRMELEPEKRLLAMAHGSNGRAISCRYNLKIRRQLLYLRDSKNQTSLRPRCPGDDLQYYPAEHCQRRC